MVVTLSAIKAFMVERKRATLTEIAVHFDSPASAIRPMLDQWLGKGRMRKLDVTGGCGKVGSSCSCKEPPSEVFEWIQ